MTAHIVKQLHDNTQRPHTPYLRVLMTYEYKGEKTATIVKVGTQQGEGLILRTIKWAAKYGVEITFRPV